LIEKVGVQMVAEKVIRIDRPRRDIATGKISDRQWSF